MESNKFDNHIKDLLEKRTIEPSSNAWSTLENRLDHSKANKKNWMLWSGIAASFIGVLITVSVFNKQPNRLETVEVPAVKNTKITPVKPNTHKEIELTNVNKEPGLVTQTQTYNSVIKKNNLNKTTQVDYINSQAGKNSSVENSLVITENEGLNELNEAKIEISPNKKATKSEAELLLAYALKNTSTTTVKTNTIDAGSLLYDVETEVDQSFRTKLFATIKESISDLKTVIVDRNK